VYFLLKMTVFCNAVPSCLAEIYLHFIRSMIEAVSTFEMFVYFYQTTRYNIPEDHHCLTHHHENLKSHSVTVELIELLLILLQKQHRKASLPCFLRVASFSRALAQSSDSSHPSSPASRFCLVTREVHG
jgi:hypothetical protein